MPSIDFNRQCWDDEYEWSLRGNEWSSSWGGEDMQWFASILPRLHSYVPAKRILEIAPGYGRWSQFLVPLCDELMLVDLSEKCIAACKERFQSHATITYHVNDGSSLEMIPDASVDLIFSFDSLVHAERDIMKKYLRECARVLATDGVGFIHHSNLGEYRYYYALLRRAQSLLQKSGRRSRGMESHDEGLVIRSRFWPMKLAAWGLIDRSHLRAISMTAGAFAHDVAECGMACVSQEIVNWGSRRLIDCISVFTLQGSKWARENRIMRNKYFMRESENTLALSALYGGVSRPR